MMVTKPFGKIVVLSLLLILSGFVDTSWANEKGEQLRRSMAEIALLNGQMAQRKDEATDIRDKLLAQIETYKKEAFKELRDNKIDTSAEALSKPRIYYNLKLIAEHQAYIDRYIESIDFYRVACDRLSYLYQQADDDLKIVNTLSDLKIDALVSQTGKILDDYLSDAQTIVVNPSTITSASPESVLAKLGWVSK